MPRCSSCQQTISSGLTSCPHCGTQHDDAATQHFAPKPPRTISYDSIDDARFVAGTIVADRYRIVGLLGKGGMGEVYRADDLKLGQPVALKFLPTRLLTDGASLARLHREVRVARQVSHKNVCRVYDIGEVNGQHFLSMEFIKGEELASLSRRIGRLPGDKAVQIARQICAGLAAAHEAGVLHRDLKPANIMIDGQGNARITDFGLAGLAEEFRHDELAAGTPAYMAPEQLEGKEFTVRSDIYSLGLLLYELFTGKRPFEAATLNELITLRLSETTPESPTAIVKDLDPVIDRVIARCLQKTPSLRPASALQVAAALPGGDPLAAALAAGETPSPEMVAATAREGALKPATAIACLLAVLMTLVFLVAFSGRTRFYRMVPLQKSGEVLAERARNILANIGYAHAPTDKVYGFAVDSMFLRYLQAKPGLRFDLVRTGQPVVIYFWYRESPRYLVPQSSNFLSLTDPPLAVSAMNNVSLDPLGRLIRFDRLPPQVEVEPAMNSNPEWSHLFAAAQLNYESFRETKPRWLPLMFADVRQAWEGPHPDHPELSVRVEAAAYRGAPVHFEVINPWEVPLRDQSETQSKAQQTASIILAVSFFAVLVGAGLVGRRNLQLGRSDRKGAFKLALFIFFVSLAGLLLGTHHVPELFSELQLMFTATGNALVAAALIWLFYIALEPEVRRRWPRLIISWTRLMAGDFRDPMVGRDTLIGGLMGLFHTAAISLGVLLPGWLGEVTRPTVNLNVNTLQGVRGLLAKFLAGDLVMSVFSGLIFMFAMLLLFMILRRRTLAIAAAWVLVVVVEVLLFASSAPQYAWVSNVLIATILVITLRLGLLAMITFQFTFLLTMAYPLTTDVSIWYSEAAIFPLVVVLMLAVYGFYVSLGGQRIWSKPLLAAE